MNQAELIFNEQKIKGIWRDEVDESVWAEIFKWHEYRIAEDVIKESKDSIFDIGAHAGFFALYCLALNSKTKLVCVEPEEKNLAALKNNLKLNNFEKKVKIISSALTLTTGDYQLKLSSDSHNHHILQNEDSNEEVVDIAGVSLLDLVKKTKTKIIGLLKMDIEGGEYDLLESWSTAEYSMIKNIILEYHESADHQKGDLITVLQENGFGAQVFPSKFDKTMGIIFAHNKRIK